MLSMGGGGEYDVKLLSCQGFFSPLAMTRSIVSTHVGSSLPLLLMGTGSNLLLFKMMLFYQPTSFASNNSKMSHTEGKGGREEPQNHRM